MKNLIMCSCKHKVADTTTEKVKSLSEKVLVETDSYAIAESVGRAIIKARYNVETVIKSMQKLDGVDQVYVRNTNDPYFEATMYYHDVSEDGKAQKVVVKLFLTAPDIVDAHETVNQLYAGGAVEFQVEMIKKSQVVDFVNESLIGAVSNEKEYQETM